MRTLVVADLEGTPTDAAIRGLLGSPRTPVIGWRRGSVSEVIEDGVTGYVVDSVELAVEAVAKIGRLSRSDCRRAFEQRFDATRMAAVHVQV